MNHIIITSTVTVCESDFGMEQNEVIFLPLSDNSESCGQIWMKVFGEVECVIINNRQCC